MSVLPAEGVTFDAHVPVAIVGAGACGLIAALAAHDGGAEAVVFERDASPSGSTALSSGLIPAAGTRFQTAKGIEDSAELLLADIQRKAHGRADPVVAEAVARASAETIEWLIDRHGLEFVLQDSFLYPGHSAFRMHAHPRKTGAALLGALLDAARRAGVDIVTSAHVRDLFASSNGRVRGLALRRPHGSEERIGCDALVLACNGYGGNREMVKRYIPEMADALYFGHAGNQGDAVRWGVALGGVAKHMGAYQGHGSVAHPHAILITWATMMEGGIQVNAKGERFSNEHLGYSEQAMAVLAQPGRVAWSIFNRHACEIAGEFEDFREAEAAGAIHRAESVSGLAALTGIPESALLRTLGEIERYRRGEANDPFGRDFTGRTPLDAPYFAVKVTGALFHTQGGLVIDRAARVLRADGTGLPNLFAGGGAACGVSGPDVAGYLSGNGLLTAVNLGRIAGESAAATFAK
ncbi:MAG TPA: FAD-dependent oxidoreductase [Candidatus Cybelea sp.]|nr:FAD-dependent oxidoreductase [Candidatus Cybelea sp.]